MFPLIVVGTSQTILRIEENLLDQMKRVFGGRVGQINTKDREAVLL